MDSRLRMYLAELVGTFGLVLVAAGTVCSTDLTGVPPMGVAAVALATGCALAALLTATAHVSPGCLNPAITLMQWVFRRLDGTRTMALIGAQLLGAVLAGLVVRLTFAADVLQAARLGTPHLTPAFLNAEGTLEFGGLLSGTAVEGFLTFVVTMAVFATLFDPRAPRLGGVVVGLAQIAAVAAGFRLTGGAANPALWFGPAVWQRTVPGLQGEGLLVAALVYCGGPVLGALLAAFVYTALILPGDKGKIHGR
jgi:aquaporin TIP